MGHSLKHRTHRGLGRQLHPALQAGQPLLALTVPCAHPALQAGKPLLYCGTMVIALEQYVTPAGNSLRQRHSKRPLFSCRCPLSLKSPRCRDRAHAYTTPCKWGTQHTSTSRSRSLASNIMAGQQLAEPQRAYALRFPAAWECISLRDFLYRESIARSAIDSQSILIIHSNHHII